MPIGRFGGAGVFLMPEMENFSRTGAAFTPHAMARQTQHQIRIFVAPADEGFIAAVDCGVIFAPDAEVAALDAVPAYFEVMPQGPLWHTNYGHYFIAVHSQALID